MLGLLEQGARAAQEAAANVRPALRIGAVTTAGEYVVPPMLRIFREAYPGLGIALAVGNSTDVFQLLLAHEIDVAITGRVPEGLPLEGEAFATNQFVVITAASDPLTKANGVAIDELAGRPWLLRERGSGTRILCEEYLASHGIRPTTLTLGSNGAIKQAAGLGLGIALQSRCAVQVDVERGLLATVSVRGGLPRRRWHVVHPAARPISDDVRAFIRFARSKAAQHALAAVAPPLA
jgi:DNA-binding transcriptional LysR family regulator